ncbi:hypothetical protein [Bordetella genomosp. 9]|uniref:hypothetical protein n=1 Tax=Bordetella genomosp. 9 TaxID=1416803 RepID=UPI0012FACCD8|nr:hypothetical protein [Bordetella genomosp. 9]
MDAVWAARGTQMPCPLGFCGAAGTARARGRIAGIAFVLALFFMDEFAFHVFTQKEQR